MLVRLPCYCASLRQATRVLSLMYDAALRPADLTITQFTLLTALAQLPRARVNDLAEALAMDQTTLSRTLKLMQRDRLITRVVGEDRRESHWVMSAEGRARLRRALPRWKAAQKQVEAMLGTKGAQDMGAVAFELSKRFAA